MMDIGSHQKIFHDVTVVLVLQSGVVPFSKREISETTTPSGTMTTKRKNNKTRPHKSLDGRFLSSVSLPQAAQDAQSSSVMGKKERRAPENVEMSGTE